MLGLGESVHSARQRFAAVGVCLALIAVALLAIRFGSVQGPEMKPFLPIVTTIWALADLMTAFLLLAQFYVNGTTFFTVLAAAYALSGLLSWPYLYAFPGVFDASLMPVPKQQISIWIWALWHAVFPVIVATSVLLDPELKRRTFSRKSTQNAVFLTVGLTVCVAAATTALIFAERSMLPVAMLNGYFTAEFSRRVAPVIALLNIFGCGLLLRRRADMTTLQLWLFVAMFTAMLDAVLLANSPARYSYGWYIGKAETVTTASVVLAILLCEVTGLYRRLAEMATIDTLTRLPNRRALDDHMRLVLNHGKRQASGLGLLVIDVDLFKGYNDSYGHARRRMPAPRRGRPESGGDASARSFGTFRRGRIRDRRSGNAARRRDSGGRTAAHPDGESRDSLCRVSARPRYGVRRHRLRCQRTQR